MRKCEVCGKVIGLFDSVVAISDSVTVHTECLRAKMKGKSSPADPAAAEEAQAVEEEESVTSEPLKGTEICLALGQVPVFIEYTNT
jgi:ribosome-binding protein aMBF1 (putative translation factor)